MKDIKFLKDLIYFSDDGKCIISKYSLSKENKEKLLYLLYLTYPEYEFITYEYDFSRWVTHDKYITDSKYSIKGVIKS